MDTTLKVKHVSVGIVELKESGCSYSIWLNGSLMIVTGDLSYALNVYNQYS